MRSLQGSFGSKFGTGLSRWMPGIFVARSYQPEWLRGDLIAGLVLVALLVPQGMAYSELAGLPRARAAAPTAAVAAYSRREVARRFAAIRRA